MFHTFWKTHDKRDKDFETILLAVSCLIFPPYENGNSTILPRPSPNERHRIQPRLCFPEWSLSPPRERYRAVITEVRVTWQSVRLRPRPRYSMQMKTRLRPDRRSAVSAQMPGDGSHRSHLKSTAPSGLFAGLVRPRIRPPILELNLDYGQTRLNVLWMADYTRCPANVYLKNTEQEDQESKSFCC